MICWRRSAATHWHIFHNENDAYSYCGKLRGKSAGFITFARPADEKICKTCTRIHDHPPLKAEKMP